MTAAAELSARYGPALARAARQFMVLHDAAEVLDALKPPNGRVAAEYLREVGNHVVREAGASEDFLQTMIRSKPAADMGDDYPAEDPATDRLAAAAGEKS